MAHHWEAEAVVDERLAQALVREQFPDVAADDVRLVAAGWDYTVHRVDGEWAFRFPRREVVLEPMRRELDVLPVLAELIEVPVPAPVHLGVPGDRFAWPFYGAPWLAGREATGAEGRAALARPLARALRSLHAPDVAARLAHLPYDVQRRADMALRAELTRVALDAAAADGLWQPPARVDRLLAAAARLGPPEQRALCHGDLHVRQLLVDGDRVTGVVDWVDVCISDPGIDLLLVFAFLPPEARPAFFEEYGEASKASLLRARVLALFLSATLARYARANDNGPLEREARASLDRAVADL